MPNDVNNQNPEGAQPAPSQQGGSYDPAPAGNSGSDNRPDTGTDSWITDDVRKAMDFDPFTPAGEEVQVPPQSGANASADGGANGSQPASGNPAVSNPASGSGTPAGSQPAQQPAQQPAAQPAVDPVAAAIAEQTRLLQQVVQGQQTQGQQPAAQTQQQPQDPLAVMPDYDYQIPDQLVVALNSEDPAERKAALAATIKGVAQGIHRTVAQAVVARLVQLEQSIPNSIQGRMEQAQQAQTVMQDFYGKFPQLNTPQLRQLVKTVAAEHLSSIPNAQWSPEMRDAIGAKVLGVLTSIAPQAQPAAQPAQAPAMFGGSAAAAQSPRAQHPGPRTQQDHMADIMNL